MKNLFILSELTKSLPLLLGYAEIHYHLKYLYPKYYLKEPEIIADVPKRCIYKKSNKLPILIIVKDAHLFPIDLFSVNILLHSSKREKSGKIELNLKIDARFYSKIIYVDLTGFDFEQWINISVEFNYKINGKLKTVLNDNYNGLKKEPFRCFWTNKGIPFPSNWFCGEPHYHSIHTSDQVEFGADIHSTKILAKAMGLHWFFVTDHSYDLDDTEHNYTKNDPELPIWKKMLNACKENDEQNFRVIPGEEVSIGNHRNRNIHLLAVNHHHFICGHGDSAEKWFKNKPQNHLKMIKRLHSDSNLFIAAHPFEKVPFAQKITLRRGQWENQDYTDSEINYLQAINSNEINEVENSIEKWIELLLTSKKYFILAGNDAHGNFNVMRQIKIPFRKLFRSYKQTFGNFFTAFYFDLNDPIAGIKNGIMIISNGPFLNFNLTIGKEKYNIGSTVQTGKAVLNYQFATNPEFGKISKIVLHIGDLDLKTERDYSRIESSSEIVLPEKGYVRMSMKTENSGLVFTNPIWIDNKI